MQIIFSGKHVEVTPALRDYAESKLSKLVRFFDHVQEVHVVQSILRNQHTVEVTLKADGTTIRAESAQPICIVLSIWSPISWNVNLPAIKNGSLPARANRCKA